MNDPHPREREAHPNIVLEETVNNLTASLTALSMRTQLLQRRIYRGQVREAPECLHSLDAIRQSTQDLAQELQRLHAVIRTRRRAQARTQGIGSHDTWTGEGPNDPRLL